MPIVRAGHNAGHDQNEHHSPVESQQGILDGHRKVPSAAQEGAHICSCAEYLLEQLERVHRQQHAANQRLHRENGATTSAPCMSRNNVRVLAFGGLHVTSCCTYWGVAGSFLHLSRRRPTGALLVFVVCKCRRNFHMVCHPVGLHGCVWL